MLLARPVTLLAGSLLAIAMVAPASGQGFPLDTPDQLKRYTDCMTMARAEPLKALPIAERWQGSGGGLAARHCAAVAMFEAGRYGPAAGQFEGIAHDMGQERPGLRAELLAQAGQAFMEAGLADRAADAQTRALALKSQDPELWIDRGLSYAAMQSWPRAISDFDHALALKPNDVEILVLRAAAWRNAGNPAKALEDAGRALKTAPDHPEALLERGYASLALGDRRQATNDFNTVLRLVPANSTAAKRAQAGLRGEMPAANAGKR